MEQLARLLAAMGGGSDSGEGGGDGGFQVLPRAFFAGSWTFIDNLNSVECNDDDTVACCIDETDCTSPFLQTFSAGGCHIARLKVHDVNADRPLGFGVMPVRAGYNGGNFYVGETELTRSVGLVSYEGTSKLMTKDQETCDAAPTILAGAEVEMHVEGGTFFVLVNGTQYGSRFEGLQGRLRFGVSLCGLGQKVEILGGFGSVAGAPADGNSLLGRKVRVRDAAALRAALEGLPLKPDPLLITCGEVGHIEVYDDKDDTYKVQLPGGVKWYTVDCLEVLPSHYTTVFSRLVGRKVRMRSEEELKRIGCAVLGGLEEQTGILKRFVESSTGFTIGLEGGQEIEAPRGAFDVGLDDGYTQFVPGDRVRKEGKNGMVLSADVDGPGWVLVRWSDRTEARCNESDLIAGEDDEPTEGSEGTPTGEMAELLRALQEARSGGGGGGDGSIGGLDGGATGDPEDAVFAGLRRTFNNLDIHVHRPPGDPRLHLEVLGVGVSCRVTNGVVTFHAETIARIDGSRSAEVTALLNVLQRDKLLGRLDLDSDGDVRAVVAFHTGDTPLPDDHIKRALLVLRQLIQAVRAKIGPFIPRGPGETFLYHSGVRFSSIKAFDISDEACHRHAPFSHGDRVRDPSDGELSTVIGVQKDTDKQEKIWFHVDGKAGAGVYSPETTQRLMKVGHQTVEPACP